MSFFILLFFALLGVVAYLANLNPGKITFNLNNQVSVELSIIALILFSIAMGGLLVIVSFGLREIKNLFLNWKETQQKKRNLQIELHYTEAMNAYLARRYRDAASLFKKILSIDPSHVRALLLLGKIHHIEKNYSEAIRLHRKARSQDDQNIEVLLALAKGLEDAERFEEAMQYLKEILQLDGTNLTAQMRLRDLSLRLQQWEDAFVLQEKILKLHLSEEARKSEGLMLLGIQYELGRKLLDLGQFSLARRHFKSAIKADKAFLPAHIGLGDTYFSEGKTKVAVALLEKSYELTGNLILLLRLEDFFIESGGPDRILLIYQKAVTKDPQNIVLRFFLGKLYYRLEMIDDAFDVLSELESQVDSFPDLYKVLGNIFVRRGELGFAVDAFKKSLKLRNRVLIPFYCAACDFHTLEWSGRCGRCKRWNSYEASPILVDKASASPLLEAPAPYMSLPQPKGSAS